jgi:hypothetical protein
MRKTDSVLQDWPFSFLYFTGYCAGFEDPKILGLQTDNPP